MMHQCGRDVPPASSFTQTVIKGGSAMNTPGLTAILCGTLLAALGSASASAQGQYPLSSDQRISYEKDLQPCLDMLRPALNMSNGDQVTYLITEVDSHGNWYRFEISATKVNQSGKVEIDSYNVGCKSNHRVAAIRLLERENEQQLPLNGELFAKQ
jgi:hypothetical protein